MLSAEVLIEDFLMRVRTYATFPLNHRSVRDQRPKILKTAAMGRVGHNKAGKIKDIRRMVGQSRSFLINLRSQ
jgi:hypothetical protein